MIGVIANPGAERAVSEFFELFKTPWEVYRNDRAYDVVLCCGRPIELQDVDCDLVLLYGCDRAVDADANREMAATAVRFGRYTLPIQGGVVTYEHGTGDLLTESVSGKAAAVVQVRSGRRCVRVGYDLFAEVERLLSKGQSTASAAVPALDLHIALLREVITSCGVAVIEASAAPAGYRFIACLTHDVDHASIRKHGLDATTLGFFYRATVGSALECARGRLPFPRLLGNWLAAARLPWVLAGLARDFWLEFDRYLQLEAGKGSTFFVIPKARHAGRTADGPAPWIRRSAYGVGDIGPKVRHLAGAGCEIGLHGIDAWIDAESARQEAREVTKVTGASEIGVRMHWLYWNEESAGILEEAGFSYDSTVGYNETVGYRAGTSQAFKPLGVSRLLELPMHVMDTALFYPRHLGLSEGQAWQRVKPLLDHAVEHGGAVTINWHDRSIAPERQWGDFYSMLVQELEDRGAWFATAEQTVSWFRKRRSVRFEPNAGVEDAEGVRLAQEPDDGLPGVQLKLHPARSGKPWPEAGGPADSRGETVTASLRIEGAPAGEPAGGSRSSSNPEYLRTS